MKFYNCKKRVYTFCTVALRLALKLKNTSGAFSWDLRIKKSIMFKSILVQPGMLILVAGTGISPKL